MGKKPKKGRKPEAGPLDALPDLLFRCSRCGTPWLRDQAYVHRGDALCGTCDAELQQAKAELYESLTALSRFAGKLNKAPMS